MTQPPPPDTPPTGQQPPPPPGPPPTAPPPTGAPRPQVGSNGLGTVDVRAIAGRLLTGNWVGSGLVAGLTLATAGVFAVALGLVAKPPDFGVDNTLTLGAVILAGAFGADFIARGEPEDVGGDAWDFGLSISTFPLTITVVSLAVAVLAFRRMTRNYPTAWPAVGDAIRVGLFVAIPLVIASLVLRSDFDELGRGWFAAAARELDFFGEDPTWGAGAVGAFFLPLLLTTVVLALACLARVDWWTGPARTVADWLAAPLRGIAALVALLPLSGLVGVVLLMFGNDRVDEDIEADDTAAAWAAIVAFLGNGGFALLGLGSGAEVGSASRERGDGESSSSSDWHRLAWYAGDRGDEPALWAAPIVLLLVLAAAAWVVARSTGSRAHLLRNLLVWVGSLLVFLPVLARLANGHGVVEVEAGGETYESSGVLGVEGFQTTLFITLIALLVALVLATALGGIDRKQLVGGLKRMQANAGRTTAAPGPGTPSAAGHLPPPPPGPPPTSGPPTSAPPPTTTPDGSSPGY